MTQDTALLPVTEADAIAFCERALRNVEYLRLSRDDLEDIRGALQSFVQKRFAEQAKPSGERAGGVERVARAIHEYLCRRDIMTYLDNDEDCEGIARAAIAALSERGAVGEEVAIPRALFDFLMGCGEIDGSSFSDLHESLPGRFWWRALLRACDRAALSSIQGAGANSSSLADTPAEKG